MTTPLEREILTRLTDEQLKTARALEDYETLWLQADPWIKFAMAELRCGDEDAFQEARLAVGSALRSWDPEKGTYGTYVTNCAHQAILDWLRSQNTHGIGSRRQAAEGAPPMVVSLDDPAETAWHETDDGDRATHLDRLTGEDLDDSTEFEAFVRNVDATRELDRLLRFADPLDAAFVKDVTRAGGMRAYAQFANVTAMSVSRRMSKIMEGLALHRHKTCYIHGTGMDFSQHRNGRYNMSESVGNPWADWAYKPTPEDVANGSAPRDDAFNWSAGARRAYPRIERRRK